MMDVSVELVKYMKRIYTCMSKLTIRISVEVWLSLFRYWVLADGADNKAFGRKIAVRLRFGTHFTLI
jgi:hypothetical protein